MAVTTKKRREHAMRKIQACVQCRQQKEIAARGLCFTCYRQAERAKKAKTDQSDAAIRRDHKRFFQGLNGLADLGVQPIDLRFILEILNPYLEPISHVLKLPIETPESEASEQVNTHTNYVHCSQHHLTKVLDELVGLGHLTTRGEGDDKRYILTGTGATYLSTKEGKATLDRMLASRHNDHP